MIPKNQYSELKIKNQYYRIRERPNFKINPDEKSQ